MKSRAAADAWPAPDGDGPGRGFLIEEELEGGGETVTIERPTPALRAEQTIRTRRREIAESLLHRFNERIVELHETTDSREETKQAVATELVDVSPPYGAHVESFIASLITDGYLRYNGIDC